MSKGYVRHGFGTVRPYLYGPYDTPDFMARVFDAREIERHEASGRRAAHVELAIGDSAVVVEAGELPAEHQPTEGSVYVYVEDVDAVYQRAVEAGAEPIAPPEDKPYGERGCGFRACANTWWVATYLATSGGRPRTRHPGRFWVAFPRSGCCPHGPIAPGRLTCRSICFTKGFYGARTRRDRG